MIADLSLLKDVSKTKGLTSTFCGPKFESFSPEVLKTDIYDGKVYDWWVAGILIYEILFDKNPAIILHENAIDYDETSKNIKSDVEFQFPYFEEEGRVLMNVCRKMLKKNVKFRHTCADDIISSIGFDSRKSFLVSFVKRARKDLFTAPTRSKAKCRS